MSDVVLEPEPSQINDTRSARVRWWVCGSELPRDEIVFFAQVVISYIVIITCIINLSLKNGDSNLWTALLSCTLGYLLPAPSLQNIKNPTQG